MPRLRVNSAIYAENDFRKEMYRRMTDRYDTVSIRALARESGISHSSLNNHLRHNIVNLDVGVLQKIVPLLKPDPTVVLKLLGYTGEDIRKFKNKKEETQC